MRTEVTAAVTCTRCQGARWPTPQPNPATFLCHRCLAVLAGRNAADPLKRPPSGPPTPAQTAARADFARQRRARTGQDVGTGT